MLMVIRTGGIDLSVGSVLALAGLLATGLQEQMHFSAAIASRLAMGAAVGFLNGWLTARFNLQPFIVTLATMGSLRGLTYVYADTPRYPADEMFRGLIGGAFVGPVPVNFIIFALAVPCVWFYLNHTVSGRAAFALGVNKEAVRLAGVDVGKHLIFAYVACGLFAAIAGVLLASRLGIAQPSVGVGYELDAIAAVVIGGGLLGGGGGTAVGRARRRAGARRRRQRAQPLQRRFLLPAASEGLDHPGGGARQAQEGLKPPASGRLIKGRME